MTIRPASTQDLPALTAIYNDAILNTGATCFVEPRSAEDRRQWLLTHQDPLYPVIVAEISGDVIGYASLSSWTGWEVYRRTVEVSVYVSAEARGQGAGNILTQAALEAARQIGHHIVIARIWTDNGPSIEHFTKFGFETIGVLREVGFRDGKWIDCAVMQRTVS